MNADHNTLRFGLDELDALNERNGIERISALGNRLLTRTYVFDLSNEQQATELIDAYMQTGLFEYVEPNYIGKGGGLSAAPPIIPNDQFYYRQYGFNNDGTFTLGNATTDADIDMAEAWDITTGSSNVVLAVLDAGLKMDHPEFAGRVWSNSNEVADGSDSDNNSYVDDINGWDFANNDNNPTDDHGHGTNVAGIAASNGNNNVGYAGADWACQIMPLKILDNQNSGFYSWWVDAIYYAVDNGANVLNMSVGGGSFSSAMEDAVDYALAQNVTIVACMMNYNSSAPQYPAAYASTIAVGATNPDDTRAVPFFWDPQSGSNYGTHIDVVAPGNYIYGPSYSSNTNYNSYWGGTSQATPMVAGISTLLLAVNPALNPTQIKAILQQTAEDQVGNSNEDVAGFDQYFGHGRVNAYDALLLGQSVTSSALVQDAYSVLAYPNPCTKEVRITADAPTSNIGLFDLTGKQVALANGNVVSVAHLNSGMYVLKGTVAGSPFAQRILVSH